jgi:hypothetical protein
MKKEALFLKPYKTLVVTAVVSFLLLIALSPITILLEEYSSALLLPTYYLTRLLGYLIYFVFAGALFALFSEKRIKEGLLISGFFLIFSFLRYFISYILSFISELSSDFLILFLSSSALSALADCTMVLALCIASCIAVLICKRICKERFTKEPERMMASLVSSASLFIFLLVAQIIDTVVFVEEQLGVVYGAEIWSIIFDYIFLIVLFVAGFFLCDFFIKLTKKEK